jgi:signal-transduction protein with cAMP-binding, CBS, and nucleotidyltransferase domain
MFARTSFRSSIRAVSICNKLIKPSSIIGRASSSGISFEPVPEDYKNDPLDETAWSALAKSCYANINWKISENNTVLEAITRMTVNKIGALAVTKGDGEKGEIIGILSERDYLNKIGVLERRSKDTKVGEICTYGRANLISVSIGNPIDKCMRKMLDTNVRHLLVHEKATHLFVGLISIKDVVKCNLAKHDAIVERLTSNLIKEI